MAKPPVICPNPQCRKLGGCFRKTGGQPGWKCYNCGLEEPPIPDPGDSKN